MAKENKIENKADAAVEILANEILNEVNALENSWRWKLGNGIIRFIEKIIGRKNPTLATDKIKSIAENLAKHSNAKTVKKKNLNKFESQALQSIALPQQNIAFIVSNSNVNETTFGDLFTAQELASCLTEQFDWKCECLSIEEYKNSKVDFDWQISMVQDIDPRNENSKTRKIAWIRNYTDKWIAQPWFKDFEIIFASSEKSKSFLETIIDAPVFLLPIATNSVFFAKGNFKKEYESEVCFTGNRWNEKRAIESFETNEKLNFSYKIFGSGWENTKVPKNNIYGKLPYGEMPNVYASTKIVIDDSNKTTKHWQSINSRVFDALAAGKLVISSNLAVKTFFDEEFPCFETAKELEQKVNYFLNNENEYKRLTEKYNQLIQEKHLYTKRAKTFASKVRKCFFKKNKISIKIAVAEASELLSWGDFHFANSLKNAFEFFNQEVEILPVKEWKKNENSEEISIHLRGIRKTETNPKCVNVLWNISHPKDLLEEELNTFQLKFSASKTIAKTKQNVDFLPQCSDPALFFPLEKVEKSEKKLFVGNSRNQFRKAIKFENELNGLQNVELIGKNWEQFVSEEKIAKTYIPYQNLNEKYQAAKVLLNDHWEDMNDFQIVSNRIFDAILAQANLCSDSNNGLSEMFENQVITFESFEEYKSASTKILSDEVKQKLHLKVLEQHTFYHRAFEILLKINALKA